eukprot:gene937-817_t
MEERDEADRALRDAHDREQTLIREIERAESIASLRCSLHSLPASSPPP